MICRHFGTCGGCVHQGVPAGEYRARKRAAVAAAFARYGLTFEVPEPVSVSPASRRRATFKAVRTASGVQLGFHEAKSHTVVDLRECPVLTPALTGLLTGLRTMLAAFLAPGETAELKLTDTPAGADVSLRWARKNDPALLGEMARWAGRLHLARVTRHGETLVELDKPFVPVAGAKLLLPAEAFLQPTEEGERLLQAFVVATLAKSRRVVDLFSGCGTFALPLATKARVHAVELEGRQLDALAAAARQPGFKPVTVEKRNLFKRPLGVQELAPYDGVCLDPPRAGAWDQAKVLAAASLKRIAYVSCDAETFARDAAALVAGGWRIAQLALIDQFLWSDRIELAAAFTRR